MNRSNLCLHVDATAASREQVYTFSTPERTETWVPIAIKQPLGPFLHSNLFTKEDNMTIAEAHEALARIPGTIRIEFDTWRYEHRSGERPTGEWEVWSDIKQTHYKGKTLEAVVKTTLEAFPMSDSEIMQKAEESLAAVA
jgi:hypothetical protein